MADTFTSLADLVKINDQNLADLNISDLLDDAPLLRALAADVASNGTEHKYLKETGAPTVGFRAVNTPVDNSVSADTLVTETLKILDASFAADKAVADAYKNGAMAFLGREGRRHLKAALSHAEKQIINGTGNEADGFNGLTDAAGLDALADEMVYNAGGTTAATASSVWLIRTNEDGNDCQIITGNDGLISMGDPVEQALTIDGSSGRFPGYFVSIIGWLALQVGGARSIGRIANVTEDAGKTLTDDLIYEALALFPASRQPNRIAMSRRSLKQLRASRTATNATGAPAPRPTDVDGIPIVVTDSITNTEALLV